MNVPKILLIIALKTDLTRHNEAREEGYFANYKQIPEGMLRLKKYLEKKEVFVDVAVCDTYLDITHPQSNWFWLSETGRIFEEQTIIDLSEYDLISVTLLSNTLATSVKHLETFLTEIRKKAPTTPFVAGGFGVWDFEFRMAARYNDLDFIVNKWGEFPLEFLTKKAWTYHLKHPIDEKQFKTVFGKKRARSRTWLFRQEAQYPPRGIFVRYHTGGKVAVSATGEFEDIPKNALYYHHQKKNRLEISTQLGCKYGKCNFCTWQKQTKWKQLSVKWVLRSVEEAYPLEMEIFDAAFLYAGCEGSIKILEGIKKLKENGKLRPEFSLGYECRADAFPKEAGKCNKLLQLMKDAGTKTVFVGFESGSDKILKEFKKGTTLAQNVHAIDAIVKANLRLGGYFILSSPRSELWDTLKTLQLIAYISKTAIGCEIRTNPALLEFTEGPLCLDERSVGVAEHKWPKDKLTACIASMAHDNLNQITGDYAYTEPAKERVLDILNLMFELIKTKTREYTKAEDGVKEENEKLKAMLETDDREELRRIILG